MKNSFSWQPILAVVIVYQNCTLEDSSDYRTKRRQLAFFVLAFASLHKFECAHIDHVAVNQLNDDMIM